MAELGEFNIRINILTKYLSHEDCRERHRDEPSIYGLYVHAESAKTLTRLAPCSDTNAAHTTSDTAEGRVQSHTKHEEKKTTAL